MGASVRGLLHDGERVIGICADTAQGTRTYQADLVVGTDGRNSIMRKEGRFTDLTVRQNFDVVWFKVPFPDFWVTRSLLGEHLQERGLRDELTDEAQLPGVDAGAQASAAMQFDDVYLGLGQACQFLSKPHLHQGVHAAGLEALPAESPCQVEVLFQQRHGHAPPGEQISQRRPGWACADDKDASGCHQRIALGSL
jgi:hypothetical protein